MLKIISQKWFFRKTSQSQCEASEGRKASSYKSSPSRLVMCNLCYRNFGRWSSLFVKYPTSYHSPPCIRSVIEQHKTHCYGLNKFSSNSPRLSRQSKHNFMHLPRRQQVVAWAEQNGVLYHFKGILALAYRSSQTAISNQASNHTRMTICFGSFI